MKSILKKKPEVTISSFICQDNAKGRKVSFGGVHQQDDSDISQGHTPTKAIITANSTHHQNQKRSSLTGPHSNHIDRLSVSQPFKSSKMFTHDNPIGSIIENQNKMNSIQRHTESNTNAPKNNMHTRQGNTQGARPMTPQQMNQNNEFSYPVDNFEMNFNPYAQLKMDFGRSQSAGNDIHVRSGSVTPQTTQNKPKGSRRMSPTTKKSLNVQENILQSQKTKLKTDTTNFHESTQNQVLSKENISNKAKDKQINYAKKTQISQQNTSYNLELDESTEIIQPEITSSKIDKHELIEKKDNNQKLDKARHKVRSQVNLNQVKSSSAAHKYYRKLSKERPQTASTEVTLTVQSHSVLLNNPNEINLKNNDKLNNNSYLDSVQGKQNLNKNKYRDNDNLDSSDVVNQDKQFDMNKLATKIGDNKENQFAINQDNTNLDLQQTVVVSDVRIDYVNTIDYQYQVPKTYKFNLYHKYYLKQKNYKNLKCDYNIDRSQIIRTNIMSKTNEKDNNPELSINKSNKSLTNNFSNSSINNPIDDKLSNQNNNIIEDIKNKYDKTVNNFGYLHKIESAFRCQNIFEKKYLRKKYFLVQKLIQASDLIAQHKTIQRSKGFYKIMNQKVKFHRGLNKLFSIIKQTKTKNQLKSWKSNYLAYIKFILQRKHQFSKVLNKSKNHIRKTFLFKWKCLITLDRLISFYKNLMTNEKISSFLMLKNHQKYYVKKQKQIIKKRNQLMKKNVFFTLFQSQKVSLAKKLKTKRIFSQLKKNQYNKKILVQQYQYKKLMSKQFLQVRRQCQYQKWFYTYKIMKFNLNKWQRNVKKVINKKKENPSKVKLSTIGFVKYY